MFYVNCIILITLLYNILGSESWKSLDSTRRFRFWTWPSNLWCMCTSTLIFIPYLQLDLWMNSFFYSRKAKVCYHWARGCWVSNIQTVHYINRMTTLHIFAKLKQNNQRCKCDNVRNNNTIPIGPPLPSRSPGKK